MKIESVGVLGAGTMGNGIAHVFARSGFKVMLCDVGQRFLDRALHTMDSNLEREVAKNNITAADRKIRNQIRAFPGSRSHLPPRGNSGIKYILDFNNKAGSND